MPIWKWVVKSLISSGFTLRVKLKTNLVHLVLQREAILSTLPEDHSAQFDQRATPNSVQKQHMMPEHSCTMLAPDGKDDHINISSESDPKTICGSQIVHNTPLQDWTTPSQPQSTVSDSRVP